MPRAFITGITGQDGSYLAELLLEKGYEVWGLVRRPTTERFANLEAIQDRLTLVQGDILAPATFFEALDRARPDELYNLAAATFVPASWDHPVMTAQFTAVGAVALLEQVRRLDPSMRVYEASSSQIFGAANESPQRESTSFRPTIPYGISKLHAHLTVGAYRTRHGLHASSGIHFNHESIRRPAEFVTRKVTRGAAAIKLGLQDELSLGNLDTVRDWSDARDHVRAMWLTLQQEAGDDYVLASGVGRTVRDLVETAFGMVGLDADAHVRVDPAFVRPPDPIPQVGDPTKARERLGWEPEIPFEDTIGAMVEQDLRELAERADAAAR